MSNPATRESAEQKKRRLDEIGGASWSYQDGMVRLQLWPKGSHDPYDIWMRPGQALELIEQGARVVRLALKESID